MTTGSMLSGYGPCWMSEHFIPYGRQSVSDADIQAVGDVLRSGWLTTGPKVREFEEALESYTGATHATVLSSDTAALHAAYAAVGVGVGHEVITTPLTFAATANAALMLGARPRFVDVEEDTGLLDPRLVAEAICKDTRAIVAVDYAGHPADYAALRAIADEAGVALVADASHSLGATDRGQAVGTLADVSTLSFHPVKPITSGEGGAVLTGARQIHERVQCFSRHGIVAADAADDGYEGPWHQEMHELGNNYRLSDIHSALGLSQLACLDGWLARRREIAAAYTEAYADLAGLLTPVERDGVCSGWHLYVVRLVDGSKRRREVFESLRAAGLGVQVHYIPVYRHPYYQRLGFEGQACPVADKFYAGALSLPMFPAMTDADVERVIGTVRETIRGQ